MAGGWDEFSTAPKASGWDEFASAKAAPRTGMGDVQSSPGNMDANRRDVGNVPAGLLTGDPETDRQIAQNLASQGQRKTLTKGDALRAGAIGLSAVMPFTGLSPVAMGAAGGALYGGGASKGGTPGEVATDAAAGGAVGAALPLAMQAAGKYVVPPVAKWLDEHAIRYGRNAISGVMNSLARRKPLDEEAVRQAFKVGAIQPGSTVEGIANRLQDAADPLSQRYANILTELESKGVQGPKARELALSMLHDANAATVNSAMGGAGGGPYAAGLRDAGESIAMRPQLGANGRLGLMQAEEMKRGLQAQAAAEYVKEGSTSLGGAARKETAGRMREAIEDAVRDQSGLAPEAAASFEPVKSELHRTLQALGAAREGAARYARRTPFGLHEAMGMASGIATGNPVEAAGAAGLMHALKDRGASTAAWLANQGSETLGGLAARPAVALPGPATQPLGAKQLADALKRWRLEASLVPAVAGEQQQENR